MYDNLVIELLDQLRIKKTDNFLPVYILIIDEFKILFWYFF
jgi:hypothetical protein